MSSIDRSNWGGSGLPILLDVDGVLANFTEGCLELAAAHGYLASEGDIDAWGVGACIGWNDTDFDAAAEEAIRKDNFCLGLRAYPDAREFVAAVRERFGRDRVFFCTSPWNGAWSAQRHDWLVRGFGATKKEIIQTCAKGLIPGHLIDDGPHNLDGRGPGQAFCMTRPWNVAWKGPRGGYRKALDWLDVVATKELAK